MAHISQGKNFLELMEMKYYRGINFLKVDTEIINGSFQSIVLIVLLEKRGKMAKTFTNEGNHDISQARTFANMRFSNFNVIYFRKNS